MLNFVVLRPLARATGVIVLSLGCGRAIAQLPAVPTPVENPTTPAKVVLGKMLFWDEQLSSDNTTACGTCHIPSVGGGDPRASTAENLHPGPDGLFGSSDDIRGSRGVVRHDCGGAIVDDGKFFPNPQVTGRKAPSAVGAAWAPEIFWDGRAGQQFFDPVTGVPLIAQHGALENQAVGPIVSDVEMACHSRTHADVATKMAASTPMRLSPGLTPDMTAALIANPTYPALFNAAFGDSAVTAARIGMAIASYERTLIPDQTPFDAFVAGNTSALTPNQQLGLQVFNTNGRCNLCHVGPLFTDDTFANIGLRPVSADHGREAITGNPADLGAFKIPSLRNVSLRGPFFHDGSRATLAEVVTFYKLGGDFLTNIDPRMQALTMTHTEELALIDFLQNGLTDPRVTTETSPFDRPLLYSEYFFNPTIGVGETGSGGHVLRVVAPQPPAIGSSDFSFGVAKGVGGASGFAIVSFAPAAPGAFFGVHPTYVDLSSFLFVPLQLGGVAGVPGTGYFNFRWSIPNDPNLIDLQLFVQFGGFDAAGADGFVVSDAVQLTAF
jgi:cytochrome c peroxidase